MKCLWTSVLLASLTLPAVVLASFCGEAAVPFSFEALPNGQPVLGCARPTCFGWTAEGTAAGSGATFYRVNRKPDGYFRKSTVTPKAIPSTDADRFKPQTAHCAATFESEQCPSESQWVGGFGPVLNASNLPLAVQCCEYEPLKLSEDRGVAVVNAGQIVIGGEVANGERQYAFDYISDVVKHTDADGKVSYDVSIRRLPCLPYPPEFAVTVDPSVKDEILRRFSNTKPTQTHLHAGTGAKAFQAPIRNFVDSNVINPSNLGGAQSSGQLIQGPFVAENDAVVGTVNQAPPGADTINGYELPPGQAPQGIVNQGGSSSYYPVSSSCGSGGGYYASMMCGFFCFSADTLVSVPGGKKRMDELKIDDLVQSGHAGEEWSRVQTWTHRLPEVKADFVRVRLVDGKELKLTGKHYIYRGDCSRVGEPVAFEQRVKDMVYADELQLEDCLFVQQEDSDSEFVETPIASIDVVKERGIYAPMTAIGDIVVNDIYASCFNIVNNNEIQLSYAMHVRDLASWSLGRLWNVFGSSEPEDISEVELMPGMQTLVGLLGHIVPHKF